MKKYWKVFAACLLVVPLFYVSSLLVVFYVWRSSLVESEWEKIRAHRTHLRRSASKTRVCSTEAQSNGTLSFSCLKKDELSYPADAEVHFFDIRRALVEFAQRDGHNKPHFQSGYGGPWLENEWITHFEQLYDKSNHCLRDIFGPFIPIFLPWEDILVENFRRYPDKLVETLHSILRPDVAYITVSQSDQGLSDILPPDTFPNVLVLSAGGFGHVPIPLMKQEERRNNRRQNRKQFCSFVGTLGHAPNEMREQMNKLLGKNEQIDYVYYYGKDWRDVMGDSRFQLVPRGVGRSSFRLVEAIQMGLIPIYIYNDIPWLPYKDLYQQEIGYAVTLEELPNLLIDLQQNTTMEQLKRHEDQILRIARSHFTPKGVLTQIQAFMLGGETDLQCQDLPRHPTNNNEQLSVFKESFV